MNNITIHVSVNGDDSGTGTIDSPLRSIQSAAEKATPGDTVEVHAGLYREWINPPHGGISETERITFCAADGEAVEIRGSEVVSGWTQESNGVWSARIPNANFGSHNPFDTLIHGDWFKDFGRPHHTAAVYLDGEWLSEVADAEKICPMHWSAQVGSDWTTVRAHFGETDPNSSLVEVNVRPAVFYPIQTGINFITVSGFTLRHAATNWAPPTAEQVGLIGTHWSRGWIIENNTISHSRCCGITLGKHGDAYDNTSADSATGYVITIERALSHGWACDTIGSHIVRNNHIHHCEQAGIVGSLGAIFSEITGNHIHHIHVQRLFGGEEQAGIKIHAAIDSLIAGNHIHTSYRAIWLDWMAQGTRVSRNLCHDNPEEDLFLEVNHGPFVIDHNLLLSPVSIKNWSEGGAYLHNLFGGEIRSSAERNRETPWHPAHSLKIAGLQNIRGGGEQFINNLTTPSTNLEASLQPKRDALTGSWTIDPATGQFPVYADASATYPGVAEGNYQLEEAPQLTKEDGAYTIRFKLPQQQEAAVDSARLGDCRVNGIAYQDYDGSPLHLNSDYFGNIRSSRNVLTGPFESVNADNQWII